MNSVVIAVAGAGKTEFIATQVAREEFPDRVLLLTYLTRNQIEDAARIADKSPSLSQLPRVMGWFSFLLNEIVRPYSKLCFPDIEVRTLCTVAPDDLKRRKGNSRYFTREGDIYSEQLPFVAVKVIEASSGMAVRRLESIVDSIYIDEAQDLRGNDLVVIEHLMNSNINVNIVCDPRQAVVSTTRADGKYKQYRDHAISDYFMNLEKERKCKVSHLNETYRFTQEIADLSDAVIAMIGDFPSTISNVRPSGHCGLFFIDKKDVEKYAEAYSATVLRLNKTAGEYPGVEVANFGECKGMTRRNVVIVATTPIENLFKSGKDLKPESARKLYVAITRAQQSVAIAVSNPKVLLQRVSEESSRWKSFNFRTG